MPVTRDENILNTWEESQRVSGLTMIKQLSRNTAIGVKTCNQGRHVRFLGQRPLLTNFWMQRQMEA
mgnify:CR=1 FL=1